MEAARELPYRARFKGTQTTCNADMHPAEVRKYCVLDETGRNLVKSAMNQLTFHHTYHRILKLARTIADLAGAENIAPVHLAEHRSTVQGWKYSYLKNPFASFICLFWLPALYSLQQNGVDLRWQDLIEA